MTATTRHTNLRTEVVRADPEWTKEQSRVVEYEFSNGREFFANPNDRANYGTPPFIYRGAWLFNKYYESGLLLTAGF